MTDYLDFSNNNILTLLILSIISISVFGIIVYCLLGLAIINPLTILYYFFSKEETTFPFSLFFSSLLVFPLLLGALYGFILWARLIILI
jgi:hypothetical protein